MGTLDPPIRGHRHRRSAAISGDFEFEFDVTSNHTPSHQVSRSLPCSPLRGASPPRLFITEDIKYPSFGPPDAIIDLGVINKAQKDVIREDEEETPKHLIDLVSNSSNSTSATPRGKARYQSYYQLTPKREQDPPLQNVEKPFQYETKDYEPSSEEDTTINIEEHDVTLIEESPIAAKKKKKRGLFWFLKR